MTIYMDCAATTPVDPRVSDLVFIMLCENYGNPGSHTHDYGSRARRAVEHARDVVSAAVACRRSEVVFTSGATESNNLALLGLADHGRTTDCIHMVSTAIEHHAVLEPLRELGSRGFSVTLVPPLSSGRVDPEAIRESLRPDTLLVSVMQVNNETGVRQPIDEVACVLADHGAFFHVDAAQGFGKEFEPLRNPRIDFISISGHKVFAPKGVGALIARRREGRRPPLTPLMFGGGQEQGLRPGSLAAPLIAGLGRAAVLAMEEGAARMDRCREFKRRLLRAMAPLNPRYNGDPDHTVDFIVNLSIPGVLAEEAMEAAHSIAAFSNGSACTTHSRTCSHVLAAMGIPQPVSDGALRFSWSHLTEEPEWEALLGAFRSVQHAA